MFETIRISRCNDRAVHPRVKRSIAVALLAILFSAPIPAVWAAPSKDKISNGESADKISNADIAEALSNPPIVPPEAQDLTSSFLDHTLPRLLTDDNRLAHQLGFGDSTSNPVIIDRALPLMLIRRDDLFKLMAGGNPFSLVNNTNNWLKDQARRLVPNRIVFSLKAANSTSETGPYSWSSVTLEMSREGSWRIIQVGAPKLSQAMRQQYEIRQANHFLVWVPDLNRHYLGQIKANDADPANPSIILTVLFNDSLADRKAGDSFDVTSKDFILRFKQLYIDLELPKKLRGQNGQEQPANPSMMRRGD